MTKYFCDGCGMPMAEAPHGNRIKRTFGRVSVEVLVALDGTWNGGEICRSCVIQAVAQGDDSK